MPKTGKSSSSHQRSASTPAAAGGGTRSSAWSTKDDETLVQARQQGLNWNQIGPRHFPNKTPNACRKRHERLMEKHNAEQWDGVKLVDLAQAYMKARCGMWSILAAEVGEKWPLVEKKCMEKGLKTLVQASRSAQRKHNDGSYYDQDDSAVGISDLDEDSEDHHEDMPSAPEPCYPPYPGGYPSQQRGPSIQSLIHPMLQPMQYQQTHMMHPQ